MITLEGLNFRQKSIAEALWRAESKDVLRALAQVYGAREVRVVQEMIEVRVVQEMILAAALDAVEDTDQAQQVLKQFSK